jgi:chromatin segregation and condensation protein Rec8/ScpA/Scc1 (kleisin family)
MSHPSETQDAPNLDGFSVDPDDFGRVADAFEAYAKYLRLKHGAMRHRLAADVASAVDLEGQADRIYAALPEWARW